VIQLIDSLWNTAYEIFTSLLSLSAWQMDLTPDSGVDVGNE